MRSGGSSAAIVADGAENLHGINVKRADLGRFDGHGSAE